MRQYEDITRRWIAVQRTGSHASKQLERILHKMFIDIRKSISMDKSEAQMVREVNNIIKKYTKLIDAELVAGLTKVANAILKNEFKLLKDNLEVKGKAPVVKDKSVKGWNVKKPFPSSNVTVQDLLDATMVAVGKQTTNAIRTGKATGATSGAVKAVTKDIELQALRRIDMVARTAVNKTANTAKDAVYEKYPKYVDRVLWVSTLDHRTSPYCQVADGKVFKVNSGPRPPAHPGCRSVVVPVAKGESIQTVQRDMLPRPAVIAKGEQALEKKGLKTRTGRIRKPSRKDNSPLKGTRVRNISYETWIKSQPAYYQDAVLGKAAAARLRSGETLGRVLKDTRSSIDFDSLGEALAA